MISAYNVSTVRNSENVQLLRIGSGPQAFRQAIDGVPQKRFLNKI